MILATRFTFILKEVQNTCIFTSKWLDKPAIYDVISRNHGN